MTTLESKPFADDGKAAVHGLRRALADVLASVGANPDQPQDISRRFGLDKTLTWRIARVVREEDAWEAVQHIPRRPSIQIFVGAMSRHGAPADRVDGVWEALKEFERFVETHSGDRETLEMMVSSAARKSAAKRMEVFRKSGFEAASALWGVRATTQAACHLLVPGAEPGRLRTATFVVLAGFRRLRPDVPWTVATVSQWDMDPEKDVYVPQMRPLDPALQPGDAPLLREFCDPEPELRRVLDLPNMARYMITEGPVGNTAAATVVLGWTYTGSVSARETYAGETGDHGVTLATPAESLVHDLYIHRDLGFAMRPTAHVYSQLPGGPMYPASREHAAQLPVPVDVTDLGGGRVGPPDSTTPEIPGYGDILERAVGMFGFPLTDFRAFRHRLRYPPIPTMAVLRHALLPRA